jgi:phosphatidate phosphatase APP1
MSSSRFKQFIRKIKSRLKFRKQISIHSYLGYANGTQFYIKGRVLKDPRIEILEGQSRLRTFYNNFKRFESDEVEGAELIITIQGTVFELVSDEEGYFDLEGEVKVPFLAQEKNAWVPYKINLKESEVITEGQILVPAKMKKYGVISDVDDTILQTFATSRLRLKMIYATFFLSPYKRLPMEGIQEVYQQFGKGPSGTAEHPIFYVSNSPWNIYDSIFTFLKIKNFPKGPIFLRDYGAHLLKKKEEADIHKLRTIRHIMEMYPGLSFLMLGDTASEDADFYLKFADEFPDRVQAIYIRNTKDTSNAKRIAKVIESRSDVNIIMVRNSAEIIEHAKVNGYI